MSARPLWPCPLTEVEFGRRVRLVNWPREPPRQMTGCPTTARQGPYVFEISFELRCRAWSIWWNIGTERVATLT